MRARKMTVAVGVIASAMTAFTLTPTSAFADYAPSSSDVVGVGSDTLQNALDFIADGDALGDGGYNVLKQNKFISIDATADANARLAYGAVGVGSGTTAGNNACSPGTGGTQGTGNQNSTHTGDKPCILNPTVLLRAGLSPILRPNGSGKGFALLSADTNSNGTSKTGLVDFARASSAQSGGTNFDSLQMGNDPVGILTSTTTNAAPALSIPQLKGIYQCTTTNWTAVGGTAGTIVPLLPQIGSGTRSYFLGKLGLDDTTVGSCVQNVEENDPEAIDASSSPVNAIEPMSQSRLFLYQGKLSDGSSTGAAGYFKDPSCVGLSAATACANGNPLTPNVKLETSGSPSDGSGIFFPSRPLYIYFRDKDINSTKPFQPGIATNWVRTMLYNPGGATPYLCSAAGQGLISAAGITPACTFTPGGP